MFTCLLIEYANKAWHYLYALRDCVYSYHIFHCHYPVICFSHCGYIPPWLWYVMVTILFQYLDSTSGDQIHVSVVNTPTLYSYKHGEQVIKYMDLFDVFPSSGPSFQTSIKIAPLGNPLRGQVVLFEEKVIVMCVTLGNLKSTSTIFFSRMLF